MWEEVGRVSAESRSGAQASLELGLLLPQAPEYWIYRHEAKDGKSLLTGHSFLVSCPPQLFHHTRLQTGHIS